MRALLIIFFSVLCLFCPPIHGLDIPPRPQNYVTDMADMISPSMESRLNEELTSFERATSHQVFIATFPSLEGGSLEDFSIRLAQAWKPGQADRDNGVILLVIRDDRLLRIEVGYGLEGALTDATTGEIIRNVITPRFQQGQFDEGIGAGAQAIIKSIQGETFPGVRASDPQGGRSSQGPKVDLDRILFWILLIAAGITAIDLFRYGTYRSTHRHYGNRYGLLEWWFRFALLLFLLNIIFRILFYMALSGGGGGSRGGGFSGGGGGSFGGGGASGRW